VILRFPKLTADRSFPLFARAASLTLLTVCAAFSGGAVNVLERGYNPLRTGPHTAETVLTPANVRSSANQFHKQFVMKVDGKIEGSPLYASSVAIAGGTHNVVYVATMHNTVFAFDADSAAQLSSRQLGMPITGVDIGGLKTVTIHSEFDVLSTPVIDPATGTLYVVRGVMKMASVDQLTACSVSIPPISATTSFRPR
jgi:PQQ-like domain